MNEFKLVVAADQTTARTPGISWGYGIGSNLNVIAYHNDKLVLYKPSSRDWSGTGCTETFEALYMLVEWIDLDRVKVIKEESPGKDWRKCRKAFIAECKEQ
jgi:hypothetical protein